MPTIIIDQVYFEQVNDTDTVTEFTDPTLALCNAELATDGARCFKSSMMWKKYLIEFITPTSAL